MSKIQSMDSFGYCIGREKHAVARARSRTSHDRFFLPPSNAFSVRYRKRQSIVTISCAGSQILNQASTVDLEDTNSLRAPARVTRLSRYAIENVNLGKKDLLDCFCQANPHLWQSGRRLRGLHNSIYSPRAFGQAAQARSLHHMFWHLPCQCTHVFAAQG